MKALILFLTLVHVSLVTAQPWTPHVIWDRSGRGPMSGYGAHIFSLGDQNDDGYMDWGVWGQGQTAGDPGESRAEFFYGGNPPSTEPYRTFVGDSNMHLEIGVVYSLGDLNGDGYMDWLVDQYLDSVSTTIDQIWYGGTNSHPDSNMVFHIPFQTAGLHGMGDFNGDGYDDIYSYNFRFDFGLIYFGGNPMDTIPDWRLSTPPGASGAVSYGDLNGDHFADFVSDVAPPWNDLYAFFGSANPDTLADVFWDNYEGYPTRIINDLNGDGRDELMAQDVGHVFLFWGGDTLVEPPALQLIYHDISVWEIEGVGDVNGDGYNDVTVSSWIFGNNNWGSIALYLGHPLPNANPAWEESGRTGPLGLIGIKEAARLGDVNGDGIEDWAIGAYNYDHDGLRGRAIIIAGDTILRVNAKDPNILHPSSFILSVYPNPFNAETTIEIVLPVYAPEVKLTIFNLLGQVVHEQHLQAVGNPLTYHFDAHDLTSGVYLVKASAGDLSVTRKLLLLK